DPRLRLQDIRAALKEFNARGSTAQSQIEHVREDDVQDAEDREGSQIEDVREEDDDQESGDWKARRIEVSDDESMDEDVGEEEKDEQEKQREQKCECRGEETAKLT